MTLLYKKLLPVTLLIAGGVFLAGCSSKPSPWTESSSPWDNRAEEVQPEAVEEYEAEPAPIAEEETIEPIGFAAAEDELAPAESEAAIMEEPMLEDVVEEPVEEPAAVIIDENAGIATQPAGNYAVQVVASSSMDQLTYFAEQHQLSNQWIAETTVDGRVWYVLMSGIYVTKSEAESALADLGEMGTTPWIRTVGSVQAVMN